MTTFYIMVMLFGIFSCFVNRYAANENLISDFTLEDRPFRMQKVNLIWEKAKKRLSGAKLGNLYADLLVQDKHEAVLKKYHIEGMDKDGLKEAQVNTAFREIIQKHGLDDLYDIDGHFSNDLLLDDEKKVYFSDNKLQSMWQRAKQAGFTERNLEKLQEEFWHQQMKIDELNFLQNEMEIKDITDSEFEESKKPGKRRAQPKSLNQELKKKHKDIKTGYYQLEGMFDKLETEKQDFKDYRVHQLWALAQKTGWSLAELESFKEELQHFESRLEKLDFLEDQLQRSADSLRESGVEESYQEKHQRLEQKTNDIGYKVKKLHNDLKIRVSKAFIQHSEL